ncbi:MAG: hypothetical protein HUU48_12345 [Flavobacteriales bacterium]|nr:hypothetical protein [Flavobacteriales bacterium]
MHTIVNFIISLNPREKEAIRKTLTLFGNKKDEDSLTLRYFDYIISQSPKKKRKKKQSIEPALFTHTNAKNLKVLQSRLKGKILDTLTLDTFIDNSKDMDSFAKHSIKLRKKMGQLHYLHRVKGKTIFFYRSLNYIIKYARENEMYLVYIDALTLKISSLANIQSVTVDHLKKYTDELENAYINSLLASRLNNMFTKVTLIKQREENGTILENEIIAFLKSTKKEILHSNSKYVKYLYYNLLFRLYLNRDQFSGLEKIAQNMLDLVANSPALRIRGRKAICYVLFSYLYANQGKLLLAEKKLYEALKYFPPNSFNHNLIIEYLFDFAINSNRIRKAKKLADLLKNSKFLKSDYIQSRYLFHEACYFFKIGKYAECNKILNRNLTLHSDSIGWGMGVFHLQFMCAFEMKNIEEMNVIIRKVKRNLEKAEKKKLPTLVTRMKIIANIMSIIIKYEGNVQRCKRQLKRELIKLKGPFRRRFLSEFGLSLEIWLKGKLESKK